MHQPQVGQCEPRRDLSRVLFQHAVPDLREAELLLEHPERMFNPGADAGIDAPDLVGERLEWVALVQRQTLAWLQGKASGDPLFGIRAIVRALVSPVPKDIDFSAVQQHDGHSHWIDARGAWIGLLHG